jgi:hypothetical protein
MAGISPVVRFGSANGLFSAKADPKVGLLGQFGPLGQSGLQIPNDPSSIVGLASDTATAVFAASQRGQGVHGMNDAPQGSSIKPQFGCGVWGESTNGLGVFGSSENNVGVFGASRNSLAGKFVGKVEVTGDLKIDGKIDAPQATITCFDVAISNADCAEEFEAKNAESLEAGMVVSLDADGALVPSTKIYDRKVAGIISGAGAYKPGVVLDKQKGNANRVPVALVGKVYCMVDAGYAPVEVGDLLTSSATPGHAMKMLDPLLALGAVIGKALAPLTSGRGLIPVLVALQ